MPCSICQHVDQAAMVEALTHASLRQVAQQYHVSKSALIRHRQRCGPLQVDQVDQGDTSGHRPQVDHSADPHPAHLVNGEVHAVLTQLASTMPTDQRYLRDPRLAVVEVLALLLQVVRDTGEE